MTRSSKRFFADEIEAVDWLLANDFEGEDVGMTEDQAIAATLAGVS